MSSLFFEPPETRCRPLLKWAGGKVSLIPQLAAFFSKPQGRYVEPFLGAGGVFLSSNNHLSDALLNDVNSELIHLYSSIVSNPHNVIEKLIQFQTRYSEEFYYSLRGLVPSCPWERAARTIFLNKCGFNGLFRLNQKGDFNVPFGKRKSCPNLFDEDNFVNVAQKFSNSHLFSQDFEEFMERCGPGDLVYCDPPYEPLSQTSSFCQYVGEKFTRQDQIRLYDSCLRAVKKGARVLVSNSVSPFIQDLYRHFPIHLVKARRNINSKSDGRGMINEILVCMSDETPSLKTNAC